MSRHDIGQDIWFSSRFQLLSSELDPGRWHRRVLNIGCYALRMRLVLVILSFMSLSHRRAPALDGSHINATKPCPGCTSSRCPANQRKPEAAERFQQPTDPCRQPLFSMKCSVQHSEASMRNCRA